MEEAHSFERRAGLRRKYCGRKNARSKKLDARMNLRCGTMTNRDVDGVNPVRMNDREALNDLGGGTSGTGGMGTKRDHYTQVGERFGSEITAIPNLSQGNQYIYSTIKYSRIRRTLIL